jgi:predicted anti-sigma-YlaC factor YlaD
MKGMMAKALYTCDQVRDFMYDYLEDRLPMVTNIRFHLHLNSCPECRAYLFLYRKAANAQAFRKENPPPEEFLASTLDFLAQEGIVDPEDDVTDDGRGKTDR